MQLEEENDTNFLKTENNNYFIKIIIKETYGDKRTYINNIYLYENIDFISTGKYNVINTIETIKEEDDSSSVFYLRESRERTLPRKKNNNNILSSNNNNINNRDNNNKINNNKINNNKNIVIKEGDELINKDLTIDEFEIITKKKDKDNKLLEKNNTSKSNINDLNINNTYDNDNDLFNINANNNLFGIDSHFNGNYSEISEKNRGVLKTDDLTNKNILLTKTNDNIDEQLVNSNNNLSKNNNEEEKGNKNNLKKSINKEQSFNDSLSSEDLENFEILKGTKTHQNNFFNPPKISEINDQLDNIEFQHSTNEFKFKTKNDFLNKKIAESYFNMQNSNIKNKNSNSNKISNNSNINNNNKSSSNKTSQNNNKKKLKKINDINKKDYISKNNNININIDDNNNNENSIFTNRYNEEINQLKEEIALLKNEFLNYKNEQEEKNIQYQNKIISLESHIKKLQINSNKMNDVVK